MGGTNAHVILEEAPARSQPAVSLPPWQLLQISARTHTALEAVTDSLVVALANPLPGTLADVAYTLRAGRRSFAYRRIAICRDLDDARVTLEARDSDRVLTAVHEGHVPGIAFLFPGQGSQYAEMGRELYEFEPVFRDEVDRAARTLKTYLGFDPREALYPSARSLDTPSLKLSQTALTQPVLFMIEYALARTLIGWGIVPEVMLGHSIGEYVAATLSGVFTLTDALALVAARGRMMQDLEPGAMVAVALPEAERSRTRPGP